jgi:hypothetical protein
MRRFFDGAPACSNSAEAGRIPASHKRGHPLSGHGMPTLKIRPPALFSPRWSLIDPLSPLILVNANSSGFLALNTECGKSLCPQAAHLLTSTLGLDHNCGVHVVPAFVRNQHEPQIPVRKAQDHVSRAFRTWFFSRVSRRAWNPIVVA